MAMTEAAKAKKIKTQEGKVADLEKKVAELAKLKDLETDLRYERNVLAVLQQAPTSDGKPAEPEYDGSATAVAAAPTGEPDPSTLI